LGGRGEGRGGSEAGRARWGGNDGGNDDGDTDDDGHCDDGHCDDTTRHATRDPRLTFRPFRTVNLTPSRSRVPDAESSYSWKNSYTPDTIFSLAGVTNKRLGRRPRSPLGLMTVFVSSAAVGTYSEASNWSSSSDMVALLRPTPSSAPEAGRRRGGGLRLRCCRGARQPGWWRQ